MSFFEVQPASCVKGEIVLLGDKSIASRSIIISAISPGKTVIENFPPNKDSLYTLKTFKRLGIKIKESRLLKRVIVFGEGLYGLKAPGSPIFVGDSGTTLRLTLGVLAGQDFTTTLAAGESLTQRPMMRVTLPLRMMGAIINSKSQIPNSKHKEEYPPITIKGGKLKPITYRMPVASAQVKSAILFAGLYAKGVTTVIETYKSRDHTERMLKLFKADLRISGNRIAVKGGKELFSQDRIFIPGDISSASFFVVLAAILPNSRILIKKVNLNPSRMGIIRVLKRMGADIKVTKSPPQAGPPSAEQSRNVAGYEPIGDLTVKSSKLNGVVVKKEEMPSLIDELPILMVAASFASGESVFEGVQELRVKETDRIRSMSENLRDMGADIKVIKKVKSEKIVINGLKPLKGCAVRTFGDHRTAMSMVVAGLAAQGKTRIDDITCINKSFPNFLSLLKRVIR